MFMLSDTVIFTKFYMVTQAVRLASVWAKITAFLI